MRPDWGKCGFVPQGWPWGESLVMMCCFGCYWDHKTFKGPFFGLTELLISGKGGPVEEFEPTG